MAHYYSEVKRTAIGDYFQGFDKRGIPPLEQSPMELAFWDWIVGDDPVYVFDISLRPNSFIVYVEFIDGKIHMMIDGKMIVDKDMLGGTLLKQMDEYHLFEKLEETKNRGLILSTDTNGYGIIGHYKPHNKKLIMDEFHHSEIYDMGLHQKDLIRLSPPSYNQIEKVVGALTEGDIDSKILECAQELFASRGITFMLVNPNVGMYTIIK